ncbi:MAG: hypothetical protein Q8N77_01500, partial [Nanoarchaeota archaeon]|nr:hypothetical protein [Nanoarchaeota archaeon]
NADLNASRNLAKHDSMTDRVSADVNQPNIPNDESKTIFNMNGIADELRDNTQNFGRNAPIILLWE